MQQLEASEPSTRCEAVRSLGALGPIARKAIPQLIALLNDGNENVRAEARTALPLVDPENRRLHELIKALRNFDESSRAAAIQDLATLADPGTIMHAVSTGDVQAHDAESILRKIQPSIPFLVKALGSENRDVRQLSAKMLEEMDDTLTSALNGLVDSYQELPPSECHIIYSGDNFCDDYDCPNLDQLAALGPAAIPVLFDVIALGEATTWTFHDEIRKKVDAVLHRYGQRSQNFTATRQKS